MQRRKRWLALLLALVLAAGLLPTAALASDEGAETTDGETGDGNTETEDNTETGGDTLSGGTSVTSENDITRAQMAEMVYKKFYPNTIADDQGFKDIGQGDEETPCTDVQRTAINVLAEKGILSGVSATEFKPNDSVTRAQAAVVLWRATGCKSTGEPAFTFSDVSPDDWFAPAVTALAATNLISGTGAGEDGRRKFEPSKEASVYMVNTLLSNYQSDQFANLSDGVTRAEFTFEAYNRYKDSPYAKAILDSQTENEKFQSKLRDIDGCTLDQKIAILFFEKLGIVKGYNEPEDVDGKTTYPFYPDVPASNLQIAAFLMQCARLDEQNSGGNAEEDVDSPETAAAMDLSAVPMVVRSASDEEEPLPPDEVKENLLNQIKTTFGEDSRILAMAKKSPYAPAAADAPETMTGSIQVEAPTITFADGKAAITAAAGATIYYTMSTDSEPADPMIDETQKYTGEIEILLSQGLTVKAIAVQYSLSSEVAEDTYKMTITPSRDSFTGGGTVTLTIANAPEGAEVSVTCDHTAYNPTKGADGAWSVTLPNASETYTFTATAAVGEKTYTDTCQVEVTRKSTGSSSSRPGSGSSSSSTTTETVTNPDGSKTTTVTNNRMDTVTETTEYPDGTTITTVTNERTDTVTQTTEYADGSSEMVETRKDGTVTTTTTDADGNETAVVENPDGSREVSVEQADGTSASAVTDADGRTKAEVSLSSRAVSAAQEEGGAVTLPIPEIPVSYDSEDASFVEIDLPRSAGAVKVEIPIPAENTAPGTVAVIVNEDGTETVVKKSVALDGGLTLTLETGATVKIVDNSKDFDDTYGHWAEDAIDFATAHEMFGGTSATTFSPDTPMTRGMLAVVLHRFENAPNHTFTESFEDVAPGSWYADGIHWMAENGIVGGYGDGNFGANDNITREQLAAILYRYANVMGYGTSGSTSLNRFSDVDSVSGYAAEAMGWAVRNGLIGGMGDGTLAPQGNATRAQVATILMRFVENLVQ